MADRDLKQIANSPSTMADMSVLDNHKDELERHEFMMGFERGRLAVTMDLLTDALVLIGQHGVYCTSNRNPTQPALDLQTVLKSINGAKELISSVMEELRKKRDAELAES
jgi:hypothetical protein